LSLTYAHAIFDKIVTPPLSQTVTNLGPRPLQQAYVTFFTYKLAIAKYQFKIIYL